MNRKEWNQHLQDRRDATGPLTMLAIRVPETLHLELKSLAAHEAKSLNALCVEVLKGAVDGARLPGGKGWCP